ncbi:MAG TPA: imidazole glycerol phosphate synthase subunit HisH [Nitrospiria bacterium]|jgi:glutamine amidotransferase|nr:imidazole glycerol phosphate synthase subunit HisH [Nitrospiria bacterium]
MCALIQILDYGSGNLFSVKHSLHRASPELEVAISSDYEKGKVDGLILPGVGSFPSAQKILGKNRKAILHDIAERKLPALGICLGMQLMFEESEEGKGKGLGLFPGKVKRFQTASGVKVPHMGWDKVEVKSQATKQSEYSMGLPSKGWGYFAHSFFPEEVVNSEVIAFTKYGHQRFASIIQNGNILGTQFHPEKSGDFGFRIISNFAMRVLARSGGAI